MAFILYDNFLWRDDITITPTSEKKTAPFNNIFNPDPYVFWETEGCDDEGVVLNLSGTGAKKPFVIGFYNVNWTKDAIVSLQCNSSNSFGTPIAQDTHVIAADIYDYSDVPRGFNKNIIVCPNILVAADADKAYIKLRIQDPDNPDLSLKSGIIFIASAASFNMRNPKTVNEGVAQRFNNPTTKFYSYDGSALHTRLKTIGHVMKCTVGGAGLYSKLAIRRIVKSLLGKPSFLSLNEYELQTSEDFSFATQVYYGYFSDLPDIAETQYYEPFIADGNLEKYGNIEYSFEFTEII